MISDSSSKKTVLSFSLPLYPANSQTCFIFYLNCMSPKFLVISSLVKFISSTKEANLQTVFLPTEGSPARTRWPRSVAKILWTLVTIIMAYSKSTMSNLTALGALLQAIRESSSELFSLSISYTSS